MKLLNKTRGVSLSFLLALSSFGVLAFLSSNQTKNTEVKAAVDITDYSACETAHNNGNASGLLTALRNITAPGSAGSYNALWTTYNSCYVRSDGKIFDYYSSITNYVPGGSAQGANYSKEGDSYNREHSIPKSWWGGAESNQGADPYIVVPTDGYVNNRRGNDPMGVVANATYTSNNGFCKLGSADISYGYTGTVFEPNDSLKGDFARIVYYAISKYSGSYGWTSGEGSSTFSGSSSKNFGLTDYAVKLYSAWSNLDPVSDWERGVNDRVSAIQGNRNPFIDHPEYANTLWGNVSGYTTYNAGAVTPSINISKTTASLTVDQTTTISATSSDSSTIYWTTSNASIASISASSSNSGANITITGEAEGTATITARASIGGNNYTKTCTVTVTTSGGGGGGGQTSDGSDTLTRDTTGVSSGSTTYTDWSGKTGESGAVYAGNSAGDNDSIQLRSNNNNSGIVTTTSGGYCRKVTVVWQSSTSSGRTLNVYGNSSAYTSPANLYSSNTQGTLIGTIVKGTSTYLDISDDYEYVGVRSNSSAMYLTSITFDWSSSGGSTKTLSSITVKNAPSKLTYTEGQYFDPTGLLLTATYSDASTATIEYAGHENEFTFTPSLTTALTTSNTSVTIGYGGKSCSQAITVNAAPVKTLSSISVSGQTTTYTVGDTFSFDGTCTATYSDSSTAPVTPTSVTSPDMSTSGNKTITVSYTEGGVTETTTYQITVNEAQGGGEFNPASVTPYTSSSTLTYIKVTSTDDIVSGKYYMFVYDTGSVAFDGSLTSLDVTSNTVSTGTISNSKFDISTGTQSAFVITAKTGGYSIKSASGKYIGIASASNGLSTSNTDSYTHTLSFSSGKFNDVITISGTNMKLQYNNASGQYKFRYFKSTQQDVYLYRIEAEKYGENFMSNVTCTGNSIQSANWSNMSSGYSSMSTTSKNIFKNATSNQSGNVIQQAVARYDYIVGKYGTSSYSNFMSRTVTPVSGSATIFNSASTNNMALIIAVALFATSSISIYLVIKKKKRQ